MKKAGWIATIAAGVVLVGGGAWGATTLAAQPTGDSQIYIDNAAPEASATPEVTPTPTVEPTPEVTESPALSADEDLFLSGARDAAIVDGLDISDEELLAGGYRACDMIAAAGTTELGHEERAVPLTSTAVHNGFAKLASEYLCG